MSRQNYVELHCLSHFSFGRGASSASELFERAKQNGYRALAITDECTLAGIVRALEASREFELKLIVGTEVTLDDGLKLVLLAEDQRGYSNICQLITRGRRRSEKGSYRLGRDDLADGLPGTLALWIPSSMPDPQQGEWLRLLWGERLWLAVELHRGADDQARLVQLSALGGKLDIPLVAAGDVHMHVRSRRAVQDTLTAIRHHLTVAEAGAHLFPNGERHLRTRTALSAIYPAALLEETLRIAERCTFDLGKLEYRYPEELVPDGHTPSSWLRELTEQGMRKRWPKGVDEKIRNQIESELALISELKYEAFFLTVEDVVRFARLRGILCQGRGSSANSAVCYALGITAVNPEQTGMLFERFVSKERNEPPDIDVDFEHERREEVIQYLYGKYGRERTALAATVVCYRGKSAARAVAKALGLPGEQVEQLSKIFSWQNGHTDLHGQLYERGFDPDSPLLQRMLAITEQLMDVPRHLSQHTGGFVISQEPLHHLVPVENAAMPERTIIQWDKDDLETLKLLKVDCLALGMLTCLHKCLDLLNRHRGIGLDLARIPDDQTTYRMIQRADTIGVFQIESRAQMSMLPRMKPENYYDLVIEVALVRPGPIQGKMVLPYLQRRKNPASITYPSEELKIVLERTLGVPLFQEQVMKLAMVAADFTAGEADQLRRSMAAWKRRGGMEYFHQRLLSGMARRGYSPEFAEQIFEQIKGFSDYGFPESHAASFALLTYISCWLKCHFPAAFTCALLNSQPLGFYSPGQLVQDLRRHDVEVRPVDVRYSDWDCSLESWPTSPDDATEYAALMEGRKLEKPIPQPALRLGLRQIAGFREDVATRIGDARSQRAFLDVEDLCARASLESRHRALLADAGALKGLAGHRHRARWAVEGVEKQLPLFHDAIARDDPVSLPVPSAGEDMLADYASIGLTLARHPLALLRKQLGAHRCRRSRDLLPLAHGTPVRMAGLVTLRQRPDNAKGTTFVTLEDEDGMVNVVVWADLAERQRRVLLEARLLVVEGRLESAEGVQHLIAARLQDLSPLLGSLAPRSRDFR